MSIRKQIKQFYYKNEIDVLEINDFFANNTVYDLYIRTAPGAEFIINELDVKLWRTGQYSLENQKSITLEISERTKEFILAGDYPFLVIEVKYSEGAIR